MSHHEGKHEKMEPENIKEILSVVSSEIPTMIKSILSSVFSEEAGRNMGKAAAAYYKELKDGRLPEPVAVKMTEEYMRTFTSIGDMLRSGFGKGKAGEDQIQLKLEAKTKEEEE
jgi:hypothetical protein